MQALAAFRDKPGKRSSVSSLDGQTWTCMGPFFLQLPTQHVHDMLLKGQSTTGTSIALHCSSHEGRCWRPIRIRCPVLCSSLTYGCCVSACIVVDRAQIEAEMETVRADIKQLLQSLQRYAPSQLSSRLLEFALKESKRSAEGKEMEMDEGQGEEDGTDEEEEEEEEEDGEEEAVDDELG